MGTTNLDSLTLGGDLTVAGTETITGGVTYAGNVALGDTSADTVTINGTTTALAPITVGVDDTGHDVKFFGATSGKSWLWDESADKMIVTGASDLLGNTQQTGTFTVGVNDTGHDVQFFGATAGNYLLWDESADQLNVQGNAVVKDALTITATTGKIASSASATTVAPFVPMAVGQALTGSGAITLTEYYSTWNTTGGGAGTLADSTVIGQVKKVQMIVDGGDGTLTFNTNATIVFADVGDVAELIWDGSDWLPIALYNLVDGATAPVYTPAA